MSEPATDQLAHIERLITQALKALGELEEQCEAIRLFALADIAHAHAFAWDCERDFIRSQVQSA